MKKIRYISSCFRVCYILFRNVCILLLLSIPGYVSAQVGIDNATPNPYAILDISATSKGILIPRMTHFERFALLSNCSSSNTCPNGLLVFDRDKEAFFWLLNNAWYLVNGFQSPDFINGTPEDNQLHPIVKNVGIGTTAGIGYKVDVNGKVQIRNQVDITTGNLDIANGGMNVNAGNVWAVNGSITAGNIHATTYARATGFSTILTEINVAGPVPVGGIVMWAGSTGAIPAGWAICDGTNGTPDLTGRMIIGYGTRSEKIMQSGGSITDGSAMSFGLGGTAGSDKVAISVGEMASHKHSVSLTMTGHNHEYMIDDGSGGPYTPNAWRIIDGSGDCDGCMGNYRGYTDMQSHSHTLTELEIGGDEAHYSLPVYYVLAFIMKK